MTYLHSTQYLQFERLLHKANHSLPERQLALITVIDVPGNQKEKSQSLAQYFRRFEARRSLDSLQDNFGASHECFCIDVYSHERRVKSSGALWAVPALLTIRRQCDMDAGDSILPDARRCIHVSHRLRLDSDAKNRTRNVHSKTQLTRYLDLLPDDRIIDIPYPGIMKDIDPHIWDI
eukprot:1391546-Amorphochlora_amoeboformis.AAC.1